jgi:hypothetical protein
MNMNRVIVRAAGIFAVMSLSATVALATPQDKKNDKPKPAQCPVCKMFLAKKPTAKSTVAVRLKKGGPVMYCCSACKMPASVLVKSSKKATKM